MQSLVNHLNQLQELVLTRDEHRATGDGSHLDRLNEVIDELTEKLPPEVRSLFLRLFKKDHAVMSPVHDGCCAVCGMRLPISQVQAVRICKALQNCPSCARILFADAEAARWVGERPSRTEPRKVGISRFSAESLMLPQLEAKSMEAAITALANNMEAQGFVQGAAKLVQSALDREALLSTAMEHGMAFPHVRGVEGGGLTLALGVSKNGVLFDDQKKRVNFIFFVTIPTAVSAFYLRLMAGLTETFLKQANRDALLAAESPEQLWKALIKATRYSIK
jgi:mannitol/fructose-specific phosphotransferase system IIA component (Ntr-type)